MGFFVCLNSGPEVYIISMHRLWVLSHLQKPSKKVTDVNEKSMNAKAKINQFLLTPRED